MEQKTYISCKDYTVSNEEFILYKNEELDLLQTYPIPTDLGKYYESENYISHTDAKKTLLDKVYQIVKNYTLKQKLKLINSFNVEEKNILDIGAGTGDFLSVCKKNNWNTYGIEPSKNARTLAIKKGIHLKEKIEELEKNQFDIITLWHVLEHIPNLFEYVKTLKKLLKPNGILIIAVPNYKSYDANYYKEFWAAYDVPRHLWHFSKESIRKIFGNIGMTIEKILPMKFDSYYVSLLSEKYKSGKMNPFKAFYIGFLSNKHGKQKKEYSSHIYIIKKS